MISSKANRLSLSMFRLFCLVFVLFFTNSVPVFSFNSPDSSCAEQGDVQTVLTEAGDASSIFDRARRLPENSDKRNELIGYAFALELSELGENATESLYKAIKDKDPFIRSIAVEALGEQQKNYAVPMLIRALSDENKLVRKKASEALGLIGDKEAVNALITALSDEDQSVCYYAAMALGEIGDKRAVEPLIRALDCKKVYEWSHRCAG